MMILRAVETAIQPLLQAALFDNFNLKQEIPVLLSEEEDRKPQMPYVVIQCTSCEEMISPGCGIFKVSGILVFKSHTRETSSEIRQMVLDSINNFAYSQTAVNLSKTKGFHCHGWHPTSGEMTVDDALKANVYEMKYWIYCMAMDNT